MNILYILGNGFDKAQGMHTSYPEFYEYLKKIECSPLLEQMKKEIREDAKLWSDMEEALGAFTSKVKTVEEMDSMHDELSQHLQNYLKKEDVDFVPSTEKRNKVKWNLINPEEYLAEADRETYDKFFKLVSKDSLGIDYYVMTLNYTNTFEKLLSASRPNPRLLLDEHRRCILQDICHVHGQLGDTIIIGVDNKNQIKNTHFQYSDEIASFLIKADANAAMKNLRHRNCEQLIKAANLIVLFGVSYGETDIRWWRLLGDELKKRGNLGVISFLYCPGEIPETRKYKLTTVEKKERQRLYSKMGLKYPSETIDNRFFIEINTLMFSK